MKCERSAFRFSVADDNQTHSPNIYWVHAIAMYYILTMLNAHAQHDPYSLICRIFIRLVSSHYSERETHAHTHTTPKTTIAESKSKIVHVQHNSWTCAMAHFDARMSWQNKNKNICAEGSRPKCSIHMRIVVDGRRYAFCLFSKAMNIFFSF